VKPKVSLSLSVASQVSPIRLAKSPVPEGGVLVSQIDAAIDPENPF